MKYKYIVIEGIDGSGKTTVANILKDILNQKGYKVFLTKEPFRSDIKEIIKKIVSEGIYDKFYGYSLACLFTSDRFLHNKVIEEYLREGYIVISDRSYHSTFCYQGIYEGFNIEWLKCITKPLRKPDVVIILDVLPEIAINRIKSARSDEFPYEKIEFLEKVRRAYLNLKNILPDENIYIIDNNGSLEKTIEEILKILL
mgnify:FL=1